MNNFSILAVILTVTTLQTVATVSQADELRTQVVPLSDLNVADARDVPKVFARLKSAADTICGELTPDRRELAISAPYRACMQRALGQAVMSVNRSILTAYAASHGIQAVTAATDIAANR